MHRIKITTHNQQVSELGPVTDAIILVHQRDITFYDDIIVILHIIYSSL